MEARVLLPVQDLPVAQYLADAKVRDREIGQYLTQPHRLGDRLQCARQEIWELLKQMATSGWSDDFFSQYGYCLSLETLWLLSISTPRLAQAFLDLRSEV